MRGKRVHVRQCHIAIGKRWSEEDGPISIAVERALRLSPHGRVFVPGRTILVMDHLDDPRSRRFYTLPDEAWEFVEAFDDGKPVRPFTFTMRREVLP